MADAIGLWLVFLDQQIKDGNVVSYRIIANSFPRDGELDLILITEHPNWAAFDLSNEYFEDLTKKLQGSLDNSRNASIDRGALRRLGGQSIYQEVKFKKLQTYKQGSNRGSAIPVVLNSSVASGADVAYRMILKVPVK